MPTFQVGDRVRHLDRPEWGVGQVEGVTAIEHEGKPAQRLSVKFDHQGRVTLHTAFARLTPADAAVSFEAPPRRRHDEGPRAAQVAEESVRHSGLDVKRLVTLPDDATDPFISEAKRLSRMVELYRFKPDGKGLIEWAVAQTAVHDPLSLTTRHQLEQYFDVFARARDDRLKEMARTLMRNGQGALLRQTMAAAPPDARRLLDRIVTGR